LYQLNNTENSKGSILDLVFTNISNLVDHNELNSLAKIDYYHPSISMTHYYSYNIINYKNNDKTPVAYNFKRADFQAISLDLGLVNWNILIGNVNIDLAIFNFYETLYCIIDKFVPKYYTCKNKFPPWFNHQLIALIKKKKKIQCIKHLNYLTIIKHIITSQN
jgi:hypothetical protein